MTACLAIALSACATGRPMYGETPSMDPGLEARLDKAAERGEAGRALREGVQALLAGGTVQANKAFSRALKLDPDNAQIHLLNAVAYHLGFAQGVQINRDLAETGYIVALRMDPNNVVAAQMLGQLYLDTGRYADARRWIGRSLLLGDVNANIYHSFAVASYYAQDLPLALWSIDKAEQLERDSAPVLRASALIRAASGEFAGAELRVQRYDALEPDTLAKRSLVRRVAQWRSALSEEDAIAARSGPREVEPIVVAQAPTIAAPAQTPVSSGPMAQNWSDCQPAQGGLGAIGAVGSSLSAADETVQLPPLPSPCAGRPLPRMAVIDVAIIRSQDTNSTQKGINLLDTLSVTLAGDLLNYSKNWTNSQDGTPSVNNRQVNRSMVASLSNALGTSSVAGGLTYSLNIANANDMANEVIARPSLLVMDRQPSTFFSGSTLSTVAPGAFSGGSRIDHPTGVSLSVTPTFIDEDAMLLTVKAGRSFLQNPGVTDVNQWVQSTRNSASANVRIRFNETMVLSGLSEREIQESENGVPLLKDIPLLQYLFKSEATLNFNHNILILLTPRRPESAETLLKVRPNTPEPAEIKEIRKNAYNSLNVTPNLHVVMASLDRRNLDSVGLYRQFRTGDLKAQVWHRKHGLERILSEIGSFLYY